MTYQSATVPYAHQTEYLTRSLHRSTMALFADMGTGKTKMLLDEFGILVSDGRVDTMVVTSGKGNYMTWVDEIRMHLPRSLDTMLSVWDGSDTMRSRAVRREFLEERTRPRILLINIEAIGVSPKAQTFVRQLLGTSRRRMIVVDESTLIKNHEADRTMQMVALGRSSEYRRIASGNPTPNTPMDLWGQFEFLGGDLLGHRSFYSFRARYAILGDVFIGHGKTRKVVIATKNLDELNAVVGGHSYRVRKEDCLDLPEKIYQIRRVALTPQQRVMYEDMQQMALATLDAEGSTASSTMVIGQMVKMHQILCGSLRDDDGVYHAIPNERIAAMLDVVRESGRQCIVWCAYTQNVRDCVAALEAEFGKGCAVSYYGMTSQEDRVEAIRRFQAGEVQYFVATPHAGGKGITLTKASTVVYYSNSYDLEHRVQSEDRCHRIGQVRAVNYVDLMVPGSLDEKIIKALRAKINVASQILGDGYKTWLI